MHARHTANADLVDHAVAADNRRRLEAEEIRDAMLAVSGALNEKAGGPSIMVPIDADLVKELAHLLFRIAEGNGWTKDALSFNTLVTSWPEILEVARSARKPTVEQGAFSFDEEGD